MKKRKGETKERQTRPSLCVGCGEAAAGYNYDAPSCNSCKTFFRRTVISGNKRVLEGCIQGGLCTAGDSARQCRGCRYQSCIKGGMNPLLLMSSEVIVKQEVVVKQEVASPSTENDSSPCCSSSSTDCCLKDPVVVETRCWRYKESLIPCDPGTSSGCSPLQLQIVQNPSRIECKIDKMIQHLFVIEDAHQKLRISSFAPPIDGGMTMDEFVDGPSRLGMNLGIMCSAPYTPMEIRLIPPEVILKYRYVMDFSGFDYSKRKLWMFHDVVYSVEFIKALPIYNQLSDRSKKVLLSSAMNCCNFTSAFFSYRHKSDRTFYPDGTTMTWDKEVQEQSPHSTRFHTALIAAMKEVEMDTKEYALLKCIVVCNPMLDGLSTDDASLLQIERERVTKVLLSYSLARRGVEKAPAFFTKLVAIVNLLTQLTTWDKNQHILAVSMGLYKNPCKFAEACFYSS